MFSIHRKLFLGWKSIELSKSLLFMFPSPGKKIPSSPVKLLIPTEAILFNLLWNLEDPVLIQTLSYRRKITYYTTHLYRLDFSIIQTLSYRRKITYYTTHLYRLDFSINWFQRRCRAYVAFTCSSPAAICTNELSLLSMAMILNKQFPFYF